MWKRQYNYLLLRDCPKASVQNSLDVMQDEQSLFSPQFLVACHGYSMQVEGLKEAGTEEQEWDPGPCVTRKISH